MGDTLTTPERPTAHPHPGYKELKPFVFAGIYPVNPSDYDNLKKALEKLHLTDSAFAFAPETSSALGFGFRAGFLGLLHLDIVKTRIEREYEIPLIVTAPNVVYEIVTILGERIIVDNPARFPGPDRCEPDQNQPDQGEGRIRATDLLHRIARWLRVQLVRDRPREADGDPARACPPRRAGLRLPSPSGNRGPRHGRRRKASWRPPTSPTTPPAVRSSSTIRCRTAPAEAGRYAPGRVRPAVAARPGYRRNAVRGCRFAERQRWADVLAGCHGG